jgi:Delta3-Delta2-enoyl-CoA isomerase
MRWGLAAEGCSSFTFPAILGFQKAAALLIAGETMTAEELNVASMVTKIFPKENLMEKVMEVAERMAGYSQTAMFTTRELMRRQLRDQLHAANLREVQALKERNENNDAMPNILAFIEETKKKREAKKQRAKL